MQHKAELSPNKSRGKWLLGQAGRVGLPHGVRGLLKERTGRVLGVRALTAADEALFLVVGVETFVAAPDVDPDPFDGTSRVLPLHGPVDHDATEVLAGVLAADDGAVNVDRVAPAQLPPHMRERILANRHGGCRYPAVQNKAGLAPLETAPDAFVPLGLAPPWRGPLVGVPCAEPCRRLFDQPDHDVLLSDGGATNGEFGVHGFRVTVESQLSG